MIIKYRTQLMTYSFIFSLLGTLVAILAFPRWGLMLDVWGLTVNPGAIVGVIALGSFFMVANRATTRLGGALEEMQKKQTLEGKVDDQTAREKKELVESLDHFQEVDEIGRFLGAVLNKDQLLRRVLEAVLKIAHCDIGYLALYEYNTNEYCYATGNGMDATMLKSSRYLRNNPVIKQILEKQRVVTLPFSRAVQQTETFAIKPDQLERFGSVAWVFMVPLVVENNVLGIVTLYLTELSANFMTAEQTLFSLVTNQAAIALGSAIQCEYAVIDRLTLVYNHEYLKERLMEEINRCRRFKSKMSFIMADIDHFKHFNDTYGHQVGDEVLKTVSQILKKNIRIVDLCARYGGEEFALVFPEVPLVSSQAQPSPEDAGKPEKVGGAVLKADQLRKMIEEHPFEVDGRRVPITVSMGISSWNWPDDQDMGREALIKKADERLYAAKKAGRNCVSWT